MSSWGASADTSAATVLAANTVVLAQSANAADLAEFSPGTIVRTRGNLWIASDQASASEEPFGAIGFAVVSEQANAAGVASVPNPISNESSDLWFTYETFQGYFATGQGVTWQRYSFDSKAMRKFGPNEAIVVVIANAHATMGLEFILKFRMLFKLH